MKNGRPIPRRAIAPLGRVSIEKIGDTLVVPLDPPTLTAANIRPLSGVRVLDLSRLLAGPTHGRTLAEHGAEVLLVNSARLANIPAFVMDTSHGKRSCCIELDEPDGVATLRGLAAGTDVFSQGYRGGSMARRGFGPEDLAALRPGIIIVTINCYGDVGPWHQRPGWEQMAQTVSGLAFGQGGADHPALSRPRRATTRPAISPPWAPWLPSGDGHARAIVTTFARRCVRRRAGCPRPSPRPPPTGPGSAMSTAT